jgi:hypothetical protein
MGAGTYTLRATKAGFERTDVEQVVNAATEHVVPIAMEATTTGYLVGYITDVGGSPAVNDPDSSDDDPHIVVKQGGVTKYQSDLHDGSFDIALPAGAYTVDYSAPGYVSVTGASVSVVAGLETDGTRALEINASGLTHEDAKERWGVAWTMAANFGGSQPPKSPVPSYNIKKWNGLFRFDSDCNHQTVGLNEYIRGVRASFMGEAFEWHYFYGVTPPESPHMFEYGWTWPWTAQKFEPPELISGANVNRTCVRIDGCDIVDQRNWNTVANVRSQWYTDTGWVDHHYGDGNGDAAGDLGGDGTFAYTTTPPPFNQQVIRFWITIGQLDESTGLFKNAPFADYSGLNFGSMMNATGYSKLQVFYRPDDDMVWVEPAYAGYPVTP